MSFGTDLKRIRGDLGMTQAMLSALSGVAESQICEYEREARTPRESTKRKLLDALGVTGRKGYICEKCGNTDHESNARFCKLCGAKIMTEQGKLVQSLNNVITDVMPHIPMSIKDSVRDRIREACRWIESQGEGGQ